MNIIIQFVIVFIYIVRLTALYKIERIPIAFCLDETYFYPTYVSTISILENKKNSTFYDLFFIVPSRIKNEYYISSTFHNLEIKYSNTTIQIIKVKEEKFLKNFLNKTFKIHVNLITMFKLFLSKLILNYEKLIYLDGDTLVLEDLSEMYNIDVNDIMFMGQIIVPSRIGDIKCLQNYPGKIKGLEEFIKNENQINAGVLLINLKIIRENNIVEKMIEWADLYWDYACTYDQTIINFISKNQTRILPAKYGVFSFSYEKYYKRIQSSNYMKKNIESYLIAFKNPGIIHYAEKRKPWFKKGKPPYFYELWWKYAKISGFIDEINTKFGNFSNQQEYKDFYVRNQINEINKNNQEKSINTDL